VGHGLTLGLVDQVPGFSDDALALDPDVPHSIRGANPNIIRHRDLA
jgi:hypothetical protein